MWKIEKIISKGNYNYALVKEHPNATKNGYVLEHRIIIENYLGRLLNPNEVVHHINKNKKDNRIENLEVLIAKEHSSLHQKSKGKKFCKLKCPSCEKIFYREFNKTHIQKGSRFTTCSDICRGKFSREIQLQGITHKVEKAISENIVLEYRKYSNDNSEETV